MKNKLPQKEYEYGFKDEDVSILNTGKGLSEEVVRTISRLKNEPEWMLEFRLKSYRAFLKLPMPKFGPDLAFLNFDVYTYFTRPSEKEESSWDEVPETIKKTFQKLGIPEAEQKYLSGVATQYESEMVYHNMLKEVEEKGVVFSFDRPSAKNDARSIQKIFQYRRAFCRQ
jgi:Fe-S cluster assembly protein SufB